MSDTNDRPTIGERYAIGIAEGATTIRARGSSGDIVLAAAWQRFGVGALLLRLLAEYDQVRGDLERAGQIAPRAIDQARVLDQQAAETARRAGKAKDPKERWRLEDDAAELKAAADGIRKRTPQEILSARAFIMLELKTLREAKEHIGALAWRMARKAKVKPEAALKISGRVLDVYLDPTCHTCDGTGRFGTAYRGDVEKECEVCKGSGHRRDVVGQGAQETTFAAVLLGELQRQASAAARGMSAALGPAMDPRDDAAWPFVRERLEILRSADAEADDLVEIAVVAGKDNGDGVAFSADELRALHDGALRVWDEAAQTLKIRGPAAEVGQAREKMRA